MFLVSSHLQASMLEFWEALCSWEECLEGKQITLESVYVYMCEYVCGGGGDLGQP